MGQEVSQEQIVAHLSRQEELIRQLQLVVDKQAKALEEVSAVNYAQECNGEKEVKDTIKDIMQIDEMLRQPRRPPEPLLTDEERALPDAAWSEPTPEQEKALQDCKPWLASMAPPDGFKYKEKDAAPNVKLQLEHIYGFSTAGCRDHMALVDNSTVLYFAGCIGVIHDTNTNMQKFFTSHTGPITCMAIHRERGIVATGEQGRNPAIFIWDIKTGKELAKLAGLHKRGIACLAFSKDGTKLFTVGHDDVRTVAVYDWSTGGVVASAPGDATNRILAVKANTSGGLDGNCDFITLGVNHIFFWNVDAKGTLSSVKGALGNLGVRQPFTCCDCTPQHVLVGTQGGEVYTFKGTQIVKSLDAHNEAINGIRVCGNQIVVASHDGFVSVWNATVMRRVASINLSAFGPVRAVDLINGDVAAVACARGRLALLDLKNGSIKTIAEVHHTPLIQGMGELDCAAGAHDGAFVTACTDDVTLRLWNANTRVQEVKAELPSAPQCVAWSPSDEFIAVGDRAGCVSIFTNKLEPVTCLRKCRRRIQCLAFSPDSTLLASGSADNVIDLYDVKQGFAYKGRLSGPNSVVLHVDFSDDGKFIQACTISYELLFFDVEGMKMVAQPRTQKNLKWATFTSVLGWNVQGIWPKDSDGSEVTCCSKSPCGTMLATAERGGILKVFQYPCVGGGLDNAGTLVRRPDCIRGEGHGEHVSQVQWLQGGQRIMTTGGTDLCIFQWRVLPKSS